MSIETPEELERLRAVGRVVARAIRAMRAHVRPGITTAELDAVGARVFARHGARSGPQLDYGFPGVNCISVDDEADHGIPGDRRLRSGELVKLDVTAELDGYYADACVTVPVGPVAPLAEALVDAAGVALDRALATAKAGTPINQVGRAVEQTITGRGFAVCRPLMGHGIGRRIHEDPYMPNFDAPDATERLTAGLVITLEPIISAGSGAVRTGRDGWTILTADGALSAHVEHTIVVTGGDPIILTAP